MRRTSKLAMLAMRSRMRGESFIEARERLESQAEDYYGARRKERRMERERG